MTDQEYIDAIAVGDQHALMELYERYRDEMIRFCRKRSNLNDDDLFDIYQETILALYKNIITGKLQSLTNGAKLKTYIFSICYHKMVDVVRKKGKIISLDTDKTAQSEFDYSDEQAETERDCIIRQAVSSLQEPCHSILTLYYWDRQSHSDIAIALNYSNPDSAKTQKNKCMKKLKSYIKTLLTA